MSFMLFVLRLIVIKTHQTTIAMPIGFTKDLKQSLTMEEKIWWCLNDALNELNVERWTMRGQGGALPARSWFRTALLV